jgi:hypothetical protein
MAELAAEEQMVELDMKTFKAVRKNMVELGLVVILYVIEWSQKAVYGLSSELRNPVAVGTWWVGLASMQYL